MDSIKLNDILRLENLDNVKIRFNLMFQENWNPIEILKMVTSRQCFEDNIGTTIKTNHTKQDKSQLDLLR
jgi:hypothetical protein